MLEQHTKNLMLTTSEVAGLLGLSTRRIAMHAQKENLVPDAVIAKPRRQLLFRLETVLEFIASREEKRRKSAWHRSKIPPAPDQAELKRKVEKILREKGEVGSL